MTGIPESGRALHTLRHTCLGAMIAFTLAGTAWAQSGTDVRAYDVPAGELAQAVNRIGQLSGVQVIYDIELLRGKRIGALSGQLTLAQALDRTLAGSGLTYELVNGNTVVIRQAATQAPAEPQAVSGDRSGGRAASETQVTTIDTVAVTGTRIRGGTTPSPVIGISAAQIQEEGFSDLGEVIRSIPQNFNGGQNPGVASGASSGVGGLANQNITGGSGLNLRGLGPDATLTLLNGRRLSYGGFLQAVDISAIPVEAVGRIEIVADGASAIYGSDAVGGVGNVILKRDYDGVSVGARYGVATDGGLTTREYTVTGGATWASGGLIATYKDSSVDPIYANDRAYTDYLIDPTTIYPGSDLKSGLISFYQSIGDVVEVRLDALRSEREQLYYSYYGGVSAYYNHFTPETMTTFISPSIDIFLPRDWTLSIGASLGEDERVQYETRVTLATGISQLRVSNCYCNESRTYEIGAEGPLFSLYGGDARLAVGTGYRENEYQQINNLTGAITNSGDEGSRFAYAEINLPLIGTDQEISGVRKLDLTAAVRGEDYDSFGSVTTPKLGVIYGPNADFTLKASWGKSFKAPTLFQRNSAQLAYLDTTSYYGGTGYPEGATVLSLNGGNPDLGAERANTLTASLAFHPQALPGLDMELTFFNVDYTNRVVQPITSYTQALSNPIYASFFDYSPTAEDQAVLLASASTLYNFSGAPYDPDNVAAILYAQYVNVAKQRIRGIDLSGSYRFDLGNGQMSIRGSTSWLDSSQKTTPAQASYDISGTRFNPAELNARLGAVWTRDGFSASAFANHTGGVTNTVSGEKGGSFNTFDTTLRYVTGVQGGVWSGLEFALSAQNLFDLKPPLFTPTNVRWAPYDSTNYSAIGRFLSISVSKHF